MHMPLPQWALWSEVAIRAGWAAVAAVLWAVMTRRGHDGGLWALIGLVFGPFAVPAALVSARRAARRPPIVVTDGPPRGSATTPAALVLVDPDDAGGWEAQASAAGAAGGRVELAVVVGRDGLDLAAREGALRRARHALTAVAAAILADADRPIRVVVGPGQAERYRDVLAGVETWTHEPTVAELDGVAARVEAADR